FEHIRIIRPSEHINGRINLLSLMPQLAELGFGEVLVEAGSTLASAFLKDDLVDEIVLYQAPKLLGAGKPLFSLPENPAALLSDGPWQSQSVEIIGQDIKWVLRKKSV
ncbi:RibD family protein, partial [Neisseria sp. P0015.S010]